MSHDICHVELQTTDLDGAKKFYKELFDWKTEAHKMPEGEYAMFNPGKGPAGGMMKSPVPGAPPFWMMYICVADLEGQTRKASELGAEVVMGKTPVEGMGYFSVLKDPQGAVFAMWESVEE